MIKLFMTGGFLLEESSRLEKSSGDSMIFRKIRPERNHGASLAVV